MNILRTSLSHRSADVAQWCASRRLQLNADKPKVIWFGSHANTKKLRDHELSVRVGPEEITSVRAVRDLGVQLDEELSMKAHVAKVSSACYTIPSASAAPDTPSRRSRSHDTAGACTCHVEARLLSRSTSRRLAVNTRATAARI